METTGELMKWLQANPEIPVLALGLGTDGRMPELSTEERSVLTRAALSMGKPAVLLGGSARVQRAAAAFKGLLPCFPVYVAAQRYLDMTLSDPAKYNVWSRGLKQLKKDAIKSYTQLIKQSVRSMCVD